MRELIACSAIALCTSVGFASPIHCTFSGAGSGTIGTTSFSDAEFLFKAIGHTEDRIVLSPINSIRGFMIDHVSADVEIDTVGSFHILSGTRTFVNHSLASVGFSRAGRGGLDLFTLYSDPTFYNWDMLGDLGPIDLQGALLQWTNIPVETSGGILVFEKTKDFPAAFTADVVSEPSSIGLLA